MRPHLTRARYLLSAPFTALVVLISGTVTSVFASAQMAVAADTTGQVGAAADGDAWTFTTPNGRRLDVQNGNTRDGAFVVANNTPGHHQDWQLIPLAHGEFRITNTATGKCLSEALPMHQLSCDQSDQSAQDRLKWHFRPVAGKTGTFTLVRSNNIHCLDIMNNAQYSDAWTQVYTCNGSGAQQWTIPVSKQAEAMKLATDYYARSTPVGA